MGASPDLKLSADGDSDANLVPVPIAAAFRATYGAFASIQGRAVDTRTGEPFVDGHGKATLRSCESSTVCTDFVALREFSQSGEFVFSGLLPDRYQVTIDVSELVAQTFPFSTRPFDVGQTAVDLGDLAPSLYPVQITEINPCTDLPPEGGPCNFSVEATNIGDSRLSLSIWVIEARDTGFTDRFQRQTGRAGKGQSVNSNPQTVQLRPGQSTTLNFGFAVPSDLAPTTFIEVRAYASGDDSPFFLLGRAYLFAIRKEGASWTVLRGER